LGIDYQEFSIPTSDNSNVFAWFLQRERALADLIFFHGNGGNISAGRLDLLVTLFKNQFNVLVFDYRGYGKSPGRPSENGILIDSEAVADFYWKNLHQENNKVVYFGRSLGGFAASFAAVRKPPHGLILEAAFPDKKTLLRFHPILLRFLALFSRYRLSAADYLKTVECPIMVIQGDRDEIVHLRVGEELYRQIQSDKELYVIPGASHNDHCLVGGSEYWKRVKSFVERLKT
jgi:pimeloyl-ACP methyl ester carboxylesterase